MILFFRTPTKSVIATEVNHELASEDIQKLSWLYGEATVENEENLKGCFIGPRREMITPWSTNAVEITQNMGLTGIQRIEEYFPVKDENAEYDPMLQRMYKGLNQEIFTVNIKPQPIVYIENLEEYNEKEVKREIYPLQLDFIVWPKMQKIMAAEAFIKTMEESEDEKEYEKNKLEKYDIKDSLNQVLKDRLNRIRDLIGEK